MYEFIGINDIRASEILDSRGMPTVRAEVLLEDGTTGAACVPSGASTGKYEAVEKRDEDHHRFHGTGVLKIGWHGQQGNPQPVAWAKRARPAGNRPGAEGTGRYAELLLCRRQRGAGCVARPCPRGRGGTTACQAYQYIGGLSGRVMPVPMMNVINGGKHAGNNIDIQEFMIMPTGARTFAEDTAGAEVPVA